MERERAVCLVVVFALLVVFGQSLGCGLFPRSTDRLLATVREGATSAERRDALLQLRGRVEPPMRRDLEGVLARDMDPATRALAARMLGGLGEPAAADALRTSVRNDASGLVRERSLRALAELLGPQVLDDLRHALENDPGPQVRAAAAELADEHLTGETAVAFLLDALRDTSVLVRVKARGLLQELTGVSAPPDRQSWDKALGRR